MSDTSVFLWINSLAGRVPPVDEFFKGIANDYFLPIISCLMLVALWFGTKDITQRRINQKAIIAAVISIGIASGLVALCNHFYFRARPFTELPTREVHLLFYKPTDSSFPSNFAAILFAIALPIFLKNGKYGLILLSIAVLGGFARIYVGIHYPLDILGGVVFGALSGSMAYGVIRVLESVFTSMLRFMRKIYLA